MINEKKIFNEEKELFKEELAINDNNKIIDITKENNIKKEDDSDNCNISQNITDESIFKFDKKEETENSNTSNEEFDSENEKKKRINESPNYSVINDISFNFHHKEKLLIFDNLSINECPKLEILKKKKKKNQIKREINFSILPQEEDDDEYAFFSKIKPKGLKNLGGTCYMNATLQCFYHIKEFSSYFLKNKKLIKKKDGLLTNGLLEMIEGLSKMDHSTYYSAHKFKNNLIEVNDLFEGKEGKDSGDLVETVLTTCQEELAGESDFPDNSIDERDEKKMFLDLYYKNSKVDSLIIKLFNFYSRTEYTCYECGVKYYNISCENMIDFNLESIYKYFSQNKCIENSTNSFDSKISMKIDDCFTYYSDINTRENVFCNYCNKDSNLLSVRSFISLPEIFIMVMKRGHGEKFECHVDFEEEIDLEDFYKNIRGIEAERSTKYTLIAGTILYGARGYGHTVAFCKHFDEKYYIFNDTFFKRTSFDEIKKEKIYLLFYQKNS